MHQSIRQHRGNELESHRVPPSCAEENFLTEPDPSGQLDPVACILYHIGLLELAGCDRHSLPSLSSLGSERPALRGSQVLDYTQANNFGISQSEVS